jgi:3-hydroxyisobutyrate dehydrogenase
MSSGAEWDGGPVGWLGLGRMGVAMAQRLLAAGIAVHVWNRTPGRADELVAAGAVEVPAAADLGSCQVVFSTVADDAALDAVAGTQLLFAGPDAPDIWVECSTVSVEASERAAAAAAAHGSAYVAAPVSGNPGVVRAGNVVFAVSGPEPAQRRIAALLAAIGRSAHDVGPAHEARVVKLCTNVLIAVIAEALSEATLLAQVGGVRRSQVLEFINDSAVGSPFTRYKSDALVALDFTATFTPELQRKDVRLALELAGRAGLAMPVTEQTEQAFTRLIDSGLGADRDFISLILKLADDAGMTLAKES